MRRRWKANAALRSTSAPALVLLLALAAACLLGSDPDRRVGDDWLMHNHMAVAVNLSPEHHFLGFYGQRLYGEDRRRYLLYNRFPVFGYLLIKLVTLPFPDDSWAQLRAARLLMLALHAAAALLAWLALRRLVRDPWTALAATLLAFSPFHALYFADSVATEGTVGLFGLLLVFHGMAVFATEGRYGQLVAKTCGALLLDWHVYALVGPFAALGLASAWRRGDGRVARRCLTLGAIAVLFGSVVLGANVAREHAALGGETPLAELPSVRSALQRTSVVERDYEGEFDWLLFTEAQLDRIGLASVPYAVSHFVFADAADVAELIRTNSRYGTTSLVALSALVVLATLVLVARPAARHRLPLTALALSGPCWVILLRESFYWAEQDTYSVHEFHSMFYVGIPLALFALTLPRLDRLLRRAGVRRRVTVLVGTVAAAVFVLSCFLMARAVHDPEFAKIERGVMADFDSIRRLAQGKVIAVTMELAASHYYRLRDTAITTPARRRFADFVLDYRLAGVRSLTPDNRSFFLYDRSVYEAVLTRRERRADAQRPVLQSPDYDVHYFRNEESWDELLYFRRECPGAADLRRQPPFFLHVRPVDANDLPADSRRRGFENRDFRFEGVRWTFTQLGPMQPSVQFWRRDGKCYFVRPLPEYDIASIRTGQFTERRTRQGVRYDDVWAGSFSPGE